MFRRALLLVALTLVCRPALAGPAGLAIWIDPDGSSYLWNPTPLPISFDGYQIASESNRLDPEGWHSIADAAGCGLIDCNWGVISALGPGGLTFSEANPGPGNLAELNLGGVGTLQPGAKWFIGTPFLDGANNDSGGDFFYHSGGRSIAGDIVPEPSTWLLAGLGGIGLLAFRIADRLRSFGPAKSLRPL